MTTVPANEVTQADLEEWYRLNDLLTRTKAAEMLLRLKIFKGFFTDAKEGTNKHPLANGYILNAKRVIRRDVDPAALQVIGAIDPATKMSRLTANGIHPEQLIKWSPELILKNYRTLTAEQMKIFDECLIIKDGSPALEIVLPAAEAKKQAALAQARPNGTDPSVPAGE